MVNKRTGTRDWVRNNRMWALRASEIGVLASGWLFVLGLWMSFWVFFSTPGLGVSFPFWPVLIADVACGFVALLFNAGRAWNHQPALLSWISAVLGLGTLIVGVLYSSGIYEILTIVASALLIAASTVSAVEIEGPIFEAPPLTWGGHPVFVSAEPTEAELRTRSDNLTLNPPFEASPGKRSVVGGEGRITEPPEKRGVVGDDTHRHEKPDHTPHVGMKSDESGIEDPRID